MGLIGFLAEITPSGDEMEHDSCTNGYADHNPPDYNLQFAQKPTDRCLSGYRAFKENAG
jgi:hypothetical protein